MKPPVCRHACRAYSSSQLDAGLPALWFRFHLWYCFLCWTYERQMTFTQEAFKETWGARPPREEIDALKDRILKKLEERPS